MARTALPYTQLAANSNTADPAGTSLTAGAGNGGQISSSRPEQTVLRAAFTTAGTVTVKAGDYPPALASGLGDLVVSVGTSATAWLGPFESGRFLQDDGSLIVECSQTAVVTAFNVPRH